MTAMMPAVSHFETDGLKQIPLSRKLEVKAAICRQVIHSCREQFGKELRSIILTGSMSRDEQIVISSGEGVRILGDAEFLLVFHETAPLLDVLAIESLCARIQGELRNLGIDCPIGIGTIHEDFLRGLLPHIFAFELRENGQVIDGDAAVLALIPAFEKSSIPLEDAWRLLCNRMIEQLGAMATLTDGSGPLPVAVFSQTAKLVLDSATSFLLFQGDYAPTYRGRLQLFSRRMENAGDSTPFSASFCETVAATTSWRLGDGVESPSATPEFLRTAVQSAVALWAWELARLTGGNGANSEPLMFEWMKLQPLSERVRGWLYVLRAQGWLRSWRHWPEWAVLSWRSSPRYWIYGAAGKLLGASGSSQKSEWIGARKWLPLKRYSIPDEQISWQELAEEIAWNYKIFLAETRA